jgi:hypothetical protein
MKKNYKIKITKSLLNKLKKYHKKMRALESDFSCKVGLLENKMEKDTKIKGIYFFICDGGYAGIGNYDITMPLVQTGKLGD